MPTSIELRRLFLREMARQAPHIIHDLFKRDDAKEWAAAWGLLSEWVISHAEWAMFCRGGNRSEIRRLRERAVSKGDLAAWEVIELRAWEEATRQVWYPPPLRLQIEVFDKDEDFRYLKPAELADRVKERLDAAIAEYHKAVFEDHPYFRLFRQLPKTRAGQDEKHLAWLIAYIAGANDEEITHREYEATGRTITDNTVSKGRLDFAKKIELEIKDRRGKRNPTRRR